MFQHTAARRRLQRQSLCSRYASGFQHTAARRRLPSGSCKREVDKMFQHTAARRRLPSDFVIFLSAYFCFNTQPREGGCLPSASHCSLVWGFNTQPREGGCQLLKPLKRFLNMFQHTAARRRLPEPERSLRTHSRFQHTAARRRLRQRQNEAILAVSVSTHSRAKAAANTSGNNQYTKEVSTHSRAKAAAKLDGKTYQSAPVSTHSRAKAAAPAVNPDVATDKSFNTQPREGGCR